MSTLDTSKDIFEEWVHRDDEYKYKYLDKLITTFNTEIWRRDPILSSRMSCVDFYVKQWIEVNKNNTELLGKFMDTYLMGTRWRISSICTILLLKYCSIDKLDQLRFYTSFFNIDVILAEYIELRTQIEIYKQILSDSKGNNSIDGIIQSIDDSLS